MSSEVQPIPLEKRVVVNPDIVVDAVLWKSLLDKVGEGLMIESWGFEIKGITLALIMANTSEDGFGSKIKKEEVVFIRSQLAEYLVEAVDSEV